MRFISLITISLIAYLSLLGACKTKSALDAEALANREDMIIREYLADKGINAERLPSGIYYQRLQQGLGSKPSNGDTVFVHYTGNIIYSYVFDSSRFKGEPFQFRIGTNQVIKGWDIGVANMSVGERGVLFIPSTLGYGSCGSPCGSSTSNVKTIPPNSILIFDVELLEIRKQR
jgi:peptidylprolyl isomerase